MKGFSNLKILKQGMQLMEAAHQLNDQYAKTDLAGLIKEINLLAIGIPSSIAHSSAAIDQAESRMRLQEALKAVGAIHEKLAGLDGTDEVLSQFKDLVNKESTLLNLALHQQRRVFKRPPTQSRLDLAARNRKPIRLAVSQGLQAELF